MGMRDRARHMVQCNPYARNLLRLLEAYVVGPGLKLIHQPRDPEDTSPTTQGVLDRATRLWEDFVQHNQRHYSFREHARRTWRDGECFVRRFEGAAWPPAVRFIDPEAIGPTREHPDSQGILTAAEDVEQPLAYLRLERSTGRLLEQIPESQVLHTRLAVDSNQKRGVTLLTPVLDSLEAYERWIETELTARRLQSSIVLWRKVQGVPTQAAPFASDSALEPWRTTAGGTHEPRIVPGSILTTGQGSDIRFVQPDTNYADAVPLGRMLLLSIAAGAGMPEFMLTSDASNANYASTMVAEGPAVKMFRSEQAFFAEEFSRLWRWVLAVAVHQGELPEDFFERVQPLWCLPELVTRDRPRERLADVRLVEASVLSRAEVARRDGADPEVMGRELARESAGSSPAAEAAPGRLRTSGSATSGSATSGPDASVTAREDTGPRTR